MSALPPKADTLASGIDVRLVPIADIGECLFDERQSATNCGLRYCRSTDGPVGPAGD